MNILLATSEALPFAMSGGLADVSSALAKSLLDKCVDCRVVMPLYGFIDQKFKEKMVFIKAFSIWVAWRKQYCGIFMAKEKGVTYYFIDNEYYFKREKLYGYFDDGERFTFFSRAVLEIIPHIAFTPDIIHCNDWQTAMVPIFIASIYSDGIYAKIRTVFTIHNIEYQGKFFEEIIRDVLGLPESFKNTVMYDGCVNLMKGAIETAHRITTVSPTYSKEILTPWFAHGLDPILRANENKLSGIINGLDWDIYNPEKDELITTSFSKNNPENKALTKSFLQKTALFKVDPHIPVIGMVGRLVEHKGIGLIKYMFDELIKQNVQFCILGSGEREFEEFFTLKAKQYPQKVFLKLGFDTALAHKIYAGADMFLMPSKSEPCGLAQMIALRYGTIPIVRETGGLADTVLDWGNENGNGFTFKAFNAHEMLNAVNRAISAYKDKERWKNLKLRALRCDNSWESSTKEYIKLYNSALD